MVFFASQGSVQAQSFNVPENGTLTGIQVLNPGETGVIGSGGVLQNTSTAISLTGGGASTVTNNGTIISTTGRAIDAANGPGSLIVNNGTISSAANTDAIFLDITPGAGITVINNGLISAAANFGAAIGIRQTNSIVVNSGTLKATGTGLNAAGVVIRGNGVSLTNTGLIIGEGTGGSGVAFLSFGDNSVMTNSGTITATGTNGTGLIFDAGSSGNTATNTGTISATGAGGVAVDFTTTTANTFLNNGLISATGAATQAIVGGTGDQTINLGTGSQIIGTVDLGGGTDTVNILGTGPSSVLTLANTENINLASNVAGVVIGNTATTVDTTGHSFLGQTVSTLNTSIHGMINNRALAPSGAAFQTVSQNAFSSSFRSNTGSLSFSSNNEPTAWGGFFGSTLERDGDGAISAYKQNYYGFAGGYEQDTSRGRFGVVAGFSTSDIETNIRSIETDVDSFFGGIYGHFPVGALTISTSLIGGYESYDNERTVVDNLNGIEIAKSKFNNFFISPSVSVRSAHKFRKNFELRPSGSVTYTASFFDDYTESGTTSSNLSVGSRTVQTLNTRLQLAGAFIQDNVELELRVGVDGRFSDQDNVEATLAGTNFQFAASDDNSVVSGFVGLGLKIVDVNGFNLIADAEYRSGNGGENALSGSLRLTYRF